jgi:hypothetical protein
MAGSFSSGRLLPNFHHVRGHYLAKAPRHAHDAVRDDFHAIV